MRDFLEGWLPLGFRDYGVKLMTFGGILSTLWNVRNKMAIEGVFLQVPTDIFFKFDSLIQKWRRLLRAADQATLDRWRQQIKGWMEEFLERDRYRPPAFELL